MELRAQGLFFSEIAKRVSMGERSVRQWVKQGGPPLHRRPSRRSIFDPYAAYVLSRWQSGVHDGKPLFEEIQARGFKGTACLVRCFLQTLRERRRPLPDLTPARPSERFSVRKAVWLFIRQASPTAETTYGLVQDFLTIVRKREGEQLDTWIEAAQQSAISELQSFVTGLLMDKDAVVAGLTLPYSNGPVETTGQRYCINSVSLNFRPADAKGKEDTASRS